LVHRGDLQRNGIKLDVFGYQSGHLAETGWDEKQALVVVISSAIQQGAVRSGGEETMGGNGIGYNVIVEQGISQGL
jgi:hypothetical protein